jgi:alcohol dehydrogenase YqhD (iron-dependent ADH family)
MENFIAYNPVKLHFGKNVIEDMGNTVKSYGNNVLLVYGKGSIKKNGIYDKVIKQLAFADCRIFEFSGIKPNPVVDDVNEAVKYARANNVEVIVAVGGGSVIDSAKVISVCIPDNLDSWKVMKGIIKPSKFIPLITVLTIAATGTEMNPFSVLQNSLTKEKIGFGNNLMFPKHSYLDPQFTIPVSPVQTAYGIVDLIAHALEAYFGEGESSISDRIIESIIKETFHFAPQVLTYPDNYEYRANIMLLATCALNGITTYGKKTSDWGVHDIGHTLSFLYDLPHGATLSIAYPAWLKLQKDRIPERIKNLGIHLFNTEDIDTIITNFEKFFISIKSPVNLNSYGLNNKNEIVSLMIKNKINGIVHKLNEDDYRKIVDLMT